MYFGWFVSDYLSKVPENLLGAILKGIKSLMFSLDTKIYKLIIDLYNMFINLCNVRLLSNTVLQELSQRIGYVLGIVMLFYVVFSFIQMLLNPDNLNDKEKGAVSIIKKTIIVIVMLGSSSFVFDALYTVQKSIINSNIISKILLPYTITTTINGEDTNSSGDSVMSNDKFGSLLSEELMMSFYQLETFDGLDMESDDSTLYKSCQATVNSFRTQIVYYNKFDLGYNCLNEEVQVSFKVDGTAVSEPQETPIVNFNWFLSPLCGLAVVYLLFMYCLKVGVRMVQLMFLEIISPMAFVSYLAPKKDTMFSKWSKIYISTYIDVFIRIAIINFIFFLISTVFSTNGETGLEFQNFNIGNDTFFKVVIILSLLTFAKRAPDLLKELLPASASKLGFGMGMKEIFGLGAGIGAVAGAATGGAIGLIGGIAGGKGLSRVSGAVRGALGGTLRGGRVGLTSKGVGKAITGAQSSQAKVNLARAQRINTGASSNALGSLFGIETGYDVDDREISALTEYSKIQSEIEGYADNNSSIKRLKRNYEAIQAAGRKKGESDSAYTKRIEAARKAYAEAKSSFVNNVLSGNVGTGTVQVSYNVDGTNYKTSYDMDVQKDAYTIQSIQAAQNKANKILDGNRDLFNGYNKVVDKDTMENNTYQANKDISVRQSQKRAGKK